MYMKTIQWRCVTQYHYALPPFGILEWGDPVEVWLGGVYGGDPQFNLLAFSLINILLL